jgi:hypothetical protein
MKVGDLVRQGDKIMIMKGRAPSTLLGVVLEITDSSFPEKLKSWQKFLGRTVSVLWENGRLTESMAENSLEVISEE